LSTSFLFFLPAASALSSLSQDLPNGIRVSSLVSAEVWVLDAQARSFAASKQVCWASLVVSFVFGLLTVQVA
jgi:hypothetical protein